MLPSRKVCLRQASTPTASRTSSRLLRCPVEKSSRLQTDWLSRRSERAQRSRVRGAFHIHVKAPGHQLVREIAQRTLLVAAVRHGGDDRVGTWKVVPRAQIDAVLMLRLFRVGDRIVHVHGDPIRFQFMHDVDHARVA